MALIVTGGLAIGIALALMSGAVVSLGAAYAAFTAC
jgi:hypothetical protein